jgi:hypothetical protein
MAGTDIARIKLDQPSDKPSLFQRGHPRYGGRKKGTRNRFGGDLREAIVAGLLRLDSLRRMYHPRADFSGRASNAGFELGSFIVVSLSKHPYLTQCS